MYAEQYNYEIAILKLQLRKNATFNFLQSNKENILKS